jgi:hypothetical protein
MKKVLIFLLLSLFCFSVYGQNTENNIDEIYLAKDDGNGKAGEPATSFITTDIPIFCVVKLDTAQPTEVKMNLIAVNVKGVKPETTVITTSYKTKDEQNRVNFRGKPEKMWVAGTYRVDIFLDGKLATAQEFEIQKSTIIADKTEKPKTTAKPVRKFRRN